MNDEIVKEKIKLIDDFYGRKVCPEDIENYTFLKDFLSDGDVTLTGGSYLFNFREEMSKLDIDIAVIQKALKGDVLCFAEAVDQAFDAIKKLKTSDKSTSPKIIKTIWFWLFHMWGDIGKEIVDSYPLQHLKFYIIGSEVINVTPITSMLGVPNKNVLQMFLISYAKYLNPEITQYRLKEDYGIDHKTYQREEVEVVNFINSLKECSCNREVAESKLFALAEQLRNC